MRTPVEDALRRLQQGNRVDAVLHAVEIGLGDRLKALARARGIVEPTDVDIYVALSALNEQLASKANAAYEARWKKLIAAVLSLRNEYAHGRGDKMHPDDARCIIDMVAMGLRHLPEV